MRGALLLTTMSAGCLVPNPAYDPQADGAGATGSGSTTAGASTGASAPADSTGGGDSAGGSTGVVETTTGDPTGAASTGAAAGSTGAEATTSGCDACSECETCEGGQCVAKPAGVACVTGDDLPCEQRIWGYVSDGCAVMPASDVAACDGAGTCLWQCADVPGAVPFKCDELCRPNPGKCSNGKDAGTVSIADVCVIEGPSPTCADKCVEAAMGEFATEHRSCDKNGKCEQTGAPTQCGNYTCKQDGHACEQSCRSDVQCAAGTQCEMMSGDCIEDP